MQEKRNEKLCCQRGDGIAVFSQLAEKLSNSSAEVILDAGLGQIHADFRPSGKMETRDIQFENQVIYIYI